MMHVTAHGCAVVGRTKPAKAGNGGPLDARSLMSSALPFLARAAAARLHRAPTRVPSRSLRISRAMAAPAYDAKTTEAPAGMSRVLFVQLGMGIDQHGQDATKAAVRAVRNAIERNSIPCIKAVVPGGSYDAVKVHVKLGVPFPDKRIDVEAIQKVRHVGR